MSGTVLEIGEKVHIISRRRFSDDPRRHFVGTVRAVDGAIARVVGYVFVLNPATSEYEKRPETRSRLFGLADAEFIVNILPEDVDVDEFHYSVVDRRLVATDGAGYTLDINEFGVLA